MDIIINYAASVVFACVGLILLGVYSIAIGDAAALKVVVVAAGCAWASCYIGAWYFATGRSELRFVALFLTILAAALAVMVVFVRL